MTMEVEIVSETLANNFILTRLIVLEDIAAFNRRQIFKFYTVCLWVVICALYSYVKTTQQLIVTMRDRLSLRLLVLRRLTPTSQLNAGAILSSYKLRTKVA
jgi:hypothetical protein